MDRSLEKQQQRNPFSSSGKATEGRTGVELDVKDQRKALPITRATKAYHSLKVLEQLFEGSIVRRARRRGLLRLQERQHKPPGPVRRKYTGGRPDLPHVPVCLSARAVLVPDWPWASRRRSSRESPRRRSTAVETPLRWPTAASENRGASSGQPGQSRLRNCLSRLPPPVQAQVPENGIRGES